MKILYSTARLDLKALSESDFDLFYTTYSDPEMMRFLGGPMKVEIAKIRMQKWAKHWTEYGFGPGVLHLKKTGEQVGLSALFHTEIENEKVLEIGWLILPAFQNQGLAVESSQGYVDYARKHLEPKAITAFPNAANKASNRICERLGFKRIKSFAYPYGEGFLDSNYWRLDPALASKK
jgi:RimJ/RimL family protein N-acetyltransferase